MAQGGVAGQPLSAESSQTAVEPPDGSQDGPNFVEMDPSGRYGRVSVP